MKSFRKWANVVSPILAAALISTAAPIAPAVAAIASIDRLIDLQADAANRDRIAEFVSRDDVRRQMSDLGVDPSDIRTRIAQLSDVEARGVAAKIDETPAVQGPVGTLMVTAVVVFLVVTVTDDLADSLPFDDQKSEGAR